MQFIDTHAHLDMMERKPGEIIRDALGKGVIKIITIGVDLESSRKNRQLAEHYDNVYTAMGFHPHESQRMHEQELIDLEALLRAAQIVAVGEIGLDYYYQHSPIESQKKAFREQIDLARRLDLPIIIHDRDAHEDTLQILKEKALGMRVILHCFSGDRDMAQWCIKQGFYLGVGGVVTFKNAWALSQIIREMPLNQLLLETDAPFLTPVPFRGKTNEPKYIPYIAQRIADLKGLPLSKVAERTTANASQCFSF